MQNECKFLWLICKIFVAFSVSIKMLEKKVSFWKIVQLEKSEYFPFPGFERFPSLKAINSEKDFFEIFILPKLYLFVLKQFSRKVCFVWKKGGNLFEIKI